MFCVYLEMEVDFIVLYCEIITQKHIFNFRKVLVRSPEIKFHRFLLFFFDLFSLIVDFYKCFKSKLLN